MICYIHRSLQPCEACASARLIRRVFGPTVTPLGAPAVVVFKPAVFEHMYDPWETPRVIDSPGELLRETAARGVESEYLRDSALWRSRPPKEI